MAVQKITIEHFLQLAQTNPVLDVRSPGEFLHAHIPGAYSLPLFTDEERKVVGTAYKQQSRETAIKIGLDYFGVKMRRMVEEVENLVKSREAVKPKKNIGNADEQKMPNQPVVLVHCWRGGMRSAGVAWLLDLYGIKVYTLTGGYKIFRQWVREQFDIQYPLQLLGGYTGSGKTLVLQELKRNRKTVIDLEGLANHKGSAFGALGENPQPTQEMFENLLAQELHIVYNLLERGVNNQEQPGTSLKGAIYIEDESQRIGLLNIPAGLWVQMRNSPLSFVDIPFEERLNYITGAYGQFEKEKLVNAVIRIQKRLGGLETKNAINYLLENNQKECFRILLTYYDKCYNKGLYSRDIIPVTLNKISCDGVDIKKMTQILINEDATAL